jgi:hypothetical protein
MIRIRGLAFLLTLSLLLVPATCADASGPHSIFVDPMATHDHHSDHEAHHHDDHAVMTQEELELHVLLGHISMDEADAIAAGDAENPFAPTPAAKQQVEENPCDHGPRLRDLPSSMAMAAAMTPIVLDDLSVIELPCAEAPEATTMLAPAPMAHAPESPPPQS